MARHLIVVDRLTDWRWPTQGLLITDIDNYLARSAGKKKKQPPYVINLCRRYAYLSGGYYCSLLAEARSQVPMPTVADVLSLARKSLYDFALPELEVRLAKTVKRHEDLPTEPFDLTVCFGQPDDARFSRLGEDVFDMFRYPVLVLKLVPGEPWRIKSIKAMGLFQLPHELDDLFISAIHAYTRTRTVHAAEHPAPLYQMAILHDPSETLPPSDAGALRKFASIARSMRMGVELITRKDYRRLPEFDALFIRTTTNIDHYTYQFARKAEQEGLIVMDDPMSILRCTNKVYLNELLTRHKLPTPRAATVNRVNFKEEALAELEDYIGYPMILKIPDGAFSRGVLKAENREQLIARATELLVHSRLILAQEYMPTRFDWRIGTLAGKPLFACQYMMSGKHWQIVNHRPDGSFRQGDFKTYALDDVPREVVEVATRAAQLVGNGLYGVDLKQTDNGVFVIEINDNPNLDSGVEDKVLKDDLYREILAEFISRIDGRV